MALAYYFHATFTCQSMRHQSFFSAIIYSEQLLSELFLIRYPMLSKAANYTLQISMKE